MSQYDVTFGQEPTGPTRTSGLAITSLICGILGCCPFLTSFLAVILGLCGMVAIGRNPALRGRWLAIFGLILGVIGLAGWGGGTAWAYKHGTDAYAFMQNGPQAAFSAAASRDAAGFKAQCWGTAASARDDQVLAFMQQLESRYGAFVACRLDTNQQPNRPFAFGDPILPFPYELEFANQKVAAEIKIALYDPQRGGFVNKMASVTVPDKQLGELKFPP